MIEVSKRQSDCRSAIEPRSIFQAAARWPAGVGAAALAGANSGRLEASTGSEGATLPGSGAVICHRLVRAAEMLSEGSMGGAMVAMAWWWWYCCCI